MTTTANGISAEAPVVPNKSNRVNFTRKVLRDNAKSKEWCEIKIELRSCDSFDDTKLRLSITGSTGYFTTPAKARKEALEYWTGFFDDSPEELVTMNRRYNKRFTSSRGAAKFVIECDGEYHGLDVHAVEADRVYILTSCGQIKADLAKWFPEAQVLLPWHLNDLNAACVHQDARGETWARNPLNVCPDCGWKLGSGWCYRELPEHVIAAINAFPTE